MDDVPIFQTVTLQSARLRESACCVCVSIRSEGVWNPLGVCERVRQIIVV